MRKLMMMALTLPLTALAQTSAPADSSAPASGDGFGSQTRLWLETQTSGANSVTESRPMPGEVASLVYQRYLNSFTYQIPERYSSESFKSSSTGSGGSSP
jgi:hypothetical protein